MNYYFLLEDEKSFLKVLPYWLQHLDFQCSRVADITEVQKNHYVLQSGQGVTQLVTKVLFDTIETIKQNPKKIDKLIVMLDAEEKDAMERKQEVYKKIEENYVLEQLDFSVEVFVCNHCFETWLLGCEGIYPKEVDIDSFFYPYYNYYNVGTSNPEDMPVPDGCNETIAKYHFHYLHELFRYQKIRYSKSNPRHVATESYFMGIWDRVKRTEHLQSFRTFIDFILNETTLIQTT